jgi:hypothetical protein
MTTVHQHPLQKILETRIAIIDGAMGTTIRTSCALRIAAQTLARSRTCLGNFYRSIHARLGGPQAITATAHKLARIVYHLIVTGQSYDESVFLHEDQKQAKRYEKRIRKQAQTLGFQLVPIPS